ncbi:unnamed protein product [Cuscuta epithymum]|uniref:Pentatricopeptide repeat-containing protein n=1 Tax=Cuscuta epithymum TaxID=186058 RepID=A0AAV0CRD1_9ASTE|nr:unnamed protein product [Cuscuta epithymum]
MALLRAFSPSTSLLSHSVRLMANRCFLTHSHTCVPFLSPLFAASRPSLLLTNFRRNASLRWHPNRDLLSSVRCTKSLMASSIAMEAFREGTGSKDYGSEQIQILQGLDPVRKRPGMYIRSTGPRGLHYLNCINAVPVGISPFSHLFTILINSASFSKSRETQPSHSVVDQRILNEIISKMEESPSAGYEICHAYTHKLCSNGNVHGAAMLMQSLHEKNIFLGPCAYTCLIEAAGEQNDVNIVCQSFKHLLGSCESIDSTSYHILAKVFIMKGDDAGLLGFCREVCDLIPQRNVTTMNRIIYAFAKHRQVEKAMLVFGQMKTSNCKPDLVTYNTVLYILCQTGRIDEMLHVYASMKEENFVPDIISFNTLINGFRKVGRLELCGLYFKEMLEKGIEPDLQTYTALIDTFSRSGNIEESLRLFNEMKHNGISPSIQIYQLLISNLKKNGKLKLAESFSQEMKASLPGLRDPNDFRRKKTVSVNTSNLDSNWSYTPPATFDASSPRST